MDVIVVGGGPAGASAAYHLATSGLDVTVIEKGSYPREKVCGDGLTPRAVAQLHLMGVDTDGPGWFRTKGLRIVGDGTRTELTWPETDGFPNYGLNRTRWDFDELLIKRTIAAGATLQDNTTVTEPLLDRAGRVVGVVATDADGKRIEFPARLVIAADGVSSRFALHLGLEKRPNRHVAAAIRRYYTSPLHDDEFIETHHDLVDPKNQRILAGYGWIFPIGDGRVNVGLGALNTTVTPAPDYRATLEAWLRRLPAEWQLDVEHEAGPLRGSGIPMGFNRTPHYTRGVMLVGDAGGVVNPFSGEGIGYAMESGYVAAKIAALALSRRVGAARERALQAYPGILRDKWGGYFRIGNVFADLLAKPEFSRLMLRYGFPRTAFMQSLFRVMTNLTDPESRGAKDRLVHAMYQLVPAA